MLNQKFHLLEKHKIVVQRSKGKFLFTANSLKKDVLHQIFQCSKKEGINPELLFSIIVIEKMNRGNFLNVIFEKILSKVVPSLLIKLDVSLGLGQIRISTAKKVCNTPCKELIHKLINPLVNIEIVAKLLKIYANQVKNNSHKIEKVINLYTTGKQNPTINKELYIYYVIVNWSIKKGYFYRLYSEI